MIKIGHGYDAHRFVDGRPLILGGVTVACDQGLAAHSDGDAVLHALCDAILGSCGLGDIGHYFADTNDQFANANSRTFVIKVMEMLSQSHYQIVNADITILAQKPKLAPYLEAMRENIASDLNTTPNNINIKATTTEGMGFVGNKEGIAVYAVVLISD